MGDFWVRIPDVLLKRLDKHGKEDGGRVPLIIDILTDWADQEDQTRRAVHLQVDIDSEKLASEYEKAHPAVGPAKADKRK